MTNKEVKVWELLIEKASNETLELIIIDCIYRAESNSENESYHKKMMDIANLCAKGLVRRFL